MLGRLVEVLSGKTLDQFFAERIFQPLGMTDSGFFVPEEKWKRLAVLYTPKKTARNRAIHFARARELQEKPAPLGGAGLVSTLTTHSRFCMMLMNDGQLDGVRILARKSVELMIPTILVICRAPACRKTATDLA